MNYDRTLTCALSFAKAGRIEAWIHEYLLTDGNNKDFADGLRRDPRYYLGPVKMPLSMFTRICGPEKGMKWLVDGDGFERKVVMLQKEIENNADMPPLIIGYADGVFELNDGNHRFEVYNRLGIKEAYVIIWMTYEKDLELFRKAYPQFADAPYEYFSE